MTEIRINQHLCRLCGCKNENGQSLSNVDGNGSGNELLFKIKETFSLLIGGNDPLPHNICIQCEQDVNVFYMKIKRFRTLEKKWRNEVYRVNPTHPYLNLQQYYDSEIDRLRETIDSTFADLAHSMEEQAIDPLSTENWTKPIEMIPIDDNVNANDDDNFNDNDHDEDETDELLNLKELARIKDRQRRQKRKKFSGYVRSRKLKRKLKAVSAAQSTDSNKKCINPMSIDAVNAKMPKLELPYKKFRNAMFEIISQNSVLENRTRVHRRTNEPFDYARATTTQSTPPTLPSPLKKPAHKEQSHKKPASATANKPSRMSSSGIDSDDHQVSCGSRNKRRINYSEELMDEAFMYEQILQDKQHQRNQQQKRKQSLTKSAESKSLDGALDAAVNSAAADAAATGNIDSRLRLLEQRNEISIMPVKSRLLSKTNSNDAHHPVASIKTEPFFNITSSVSVHIKAKTDQQAQNLQISNITSLAPPKKRCKKTCDRCQLKCSDQKQLAIHQMEHMKIVAYKMDALRVLHPKLRRGRMLNVDNEQFIRCVNCWMLHKNNKSILEHWNRGNCMFYCTICGKSFHSSIKDLQPHIEEVHGIKQSTINACRFAVPISETTTASTSKSTATSASVAAVPQAKPSKVVKLQLKTELLKQLIKPAQTAAAKKSTTDVSKKLPQANSSGDDSHTKCDPCNRIFKSRKAFSSHYASIHKKGGLDARARKPKPSTICSKTINPIAVLSKKVKSKSKNQSKSTDKKWKLVSSNGAVMKTVIRKVPSVTTVQKQQKQNQLHQQPSAKSSIKSNTHVKAICETMPSNQQNGPASANVFAPRNADETEISQDQTVSSSYLSATATFAQPDDTGDFEIKPEPMEDYSNSYMDMPMQSYNHNGWVHLPQSHDEWNYNGNVDSYAADDSSRACLKVKDFAVEQHQQQHHQQQQRYPVESQGYIQPNPMYKDHSGILSNQTGFLQIENVHSYQVPQPVPPPPVLHAPPLPPSQPTLQLQPPPLQLIPVQHHHHPQQQHPQQTAYGSASYSSCVNTMNLPSSNQGMCPPTTLYPNNQPQIINQNQHHHHPFMISQTPPPPPPQTSTHNVQYHY